MWKTIRVMCTCVLLSACTLSLANAQPWLTAKYQQVPGGYKYYLTAYNNTNPTDGLYVWAVEARLPGATSQDIPAGWEIGSHMNTWSVLWATSWGHGIAPGKSLSGFNMTMPTLVDSFTYDIYWGNSQSGNAMCGYVTPEPVPEPSALLGLVGGVGALPLLRRRRSDR